MLTTSEHVFAHTFAEALGIIPRTYTYSRLVVLMDENVQKLYGKTAESFLPPHVLFTIPSGEQYKTLETCEKIWQFLYREQIDRKALVLVIGGGVTTDLGGWVCATWKRGIRFILFPTTLMSMVDASIGGKFAVDFRLAKNLLGTFEYSEKIVCVPLFLETLSARDLKSGFAEMLKHALIADAGYWDRLQVLPTTPKEWLSLIGRSVEIKQSIVESDPLETGPRKALNFGHSIGHALESWALANAVDLSHGEAVAQGMAVEAYLSIQHTGLLPQEYEKILTRLKNLNYPIKVPASVVFNDLKPFLFQDKKNEGGKLLFTQLPHLGTVKWDVEVSLPAVGEAFEKVLR